MIEFLSSKHNLQKGLLLCFYLKKSVVKSRRVLQEAYGDHGSINFHSSTASDTLKVVILYQRQRMIRAAKKNWRLRIGGITQWRFMSNTIKACRIVGSDSRSHFKTTESPWNDSKAKKLGAIQIELRLRYFTCE